MSRAQRARARELFREHDFRWLLIGQFIAQAGDGFAQATFTNILVLEPTSAETPEQILYLFALTLLPYSLVSPFMGVFVDRWARRALMSRSNVIRGVLLMGLPLWERLLPGEIIIYATMLLLLSLGRLFLTAKSALLPTVLHEHHLIRANSLSSGGGMIAALLGGAIGLFGSSGLGQTTAFEVSGLLYLGAALALTRLSQPFSHPHERLENPSQAIARISVELYDGIKAIWVRVRARLALIGIFLVRTVAMFVFIAAILVIKEAFPGRAEEFGRLSTSALALGATGTGALVGAVTAPMIGRRLDKAGLILFGSFVSGAAIVALGGIQNVFALLTLMFLGGYGGFVTKVAVDVQVQEALPDELRGRAFALYDILFNLASVVAGVLLVVTQTFELRPTLLATGSVSLLFAVLLGAAMRRAGMEMTRSRPAS